MRMRGLRWAVNVRHLWTLTQRLNAQPICQAASAITRPFNNFEVAVRDGVVTIASDARSYPDKASALIRVIPIRISISNLSLIWSRTDYAATLTTIWAKPR